MPPLNTIPTSEELLKLVGNGNADAWTTFYGVYHPAMLVYARSRLSPSQQHLSDDIVQEVFVALARRMSDFKYASAQGRFRDYLASCIRHKIADYMNERERENKLLKDIAEDALLEGPNKSSAIADTLLAEAVRRVRESGRLEKSTWDAYQEYVVEGNAVADVAAKYGSEANAVYQIKNRVSKMVREEYDKINRLRPWHD